MDSLQATYREEDEDEDEQQQQPPNNSNTHRNSPTRPPPFTTTTTSSPIELEEHQNGANPPQNDTETTTIDNTTANQQPQQEDAFVSASESLSESDHPTTSNDTEKPTPKSPKIEDTEIDDIEDDEDEEDPPPKKQKQLSSLTQKQELPEPTTAAEIENNNDSNGATEFKKPTKITPTAKKKSKKKNNNNVWVTRSTRKGKKKTKPNPQNTPSEDTVLITPVPRFPDKSDDTPDLKICLSKVYKAEKVELSEDRLSAGSIKGYRMVRATRGVSEGAWYFEIKVVSLGETGHTRLGWSTEKGDLQAPVGYDGNSFGYRDIDGSKVHKALREKYGEEGYKEGDVIGFYISLPEGELYTPKPAHLVWYKGQRYVCAPDAKEDPPKIVPGSGGGMAGSVLKLEATCTCTNCDTISLVGRLNLWYEESYSHFPDAVVLPGGLEYKKGGKVSSSLWQCAARFVGKERFQPLLLSVHMGQAAGSPTVHWKFLNLALQNLIRFWFVNADGSEISFFKNGVCQGVAFKDLFGGRYYPAASMYTLPNQPNCVVKFNFGPDFEFFPEDFGGRSVPKPMFDVPYHGFDNRAENGVTEEKKP
ncbi:unnamed protein product [Dovyalis caffra]|uniref:B30.2/SPRY domain-containing protein n=1 Tax=Dovyalis caffra TaxID=77055 RepID=A0AAV1R9D7_9ROSI|nr:unnamed protein product [Dovyalis caffra]